MNKSLNTLNPFLLYIPITVSVFSHALVFIGIYFAWFGLTNGTGGEFCEFAHEGIIKQPSNTFSNFGFMLAGLFAAWQLYKGKFDKNNNPLTRTLFFPIVLCSLMILLSPGSMAMHATETSVGGYFDMLSMYLIAAIIFSYATFRLFHLSAVAYVAVFIFTLVVCHVFHFLDWQPPLVGFSGSFIFGVFCIFGVVFEILHKIKDKAEIEIKWVVFASISFALAFAIWQIGWDGHPWCVPTSLFQAHAAWHILDAVAIYCFFRLYASENLV